MTGEVPSAANGIFKNCLTRTAETTVCSPTIYQRDKPPKLYLSFIRLAGLPGLTKK